MAAFREMYERIVYPHLRPSQQIVLVPFAHYCEFYCPIGALPLDHADAYTRSVAESYTAWADADAARASTATLARASERVAAAVARLFARSRDVATRALSSDAAALDGAGSDAAPAAAAAALARECEPARHLVE